MVISSLTEELTKGFGGNPNQQLLRHIFTYLPTYQSWLTSVSDENISVQIYPIRTPEPNESSDPWILLRVYLHTTGSTLCFLGLPFVVDEKSNGDWSGKGPRKFRRFTSKTDELLSGFTLVSLPPSLPPRRRSDIISPYGSGRCDYVWSTAGRGRTLSCPP